MCGEQVHITGPAKAVPFGIRGDRLYWAHTDPIGDPAVNLALDDHRIDPHAAVVDRDEPADHHLAGPWVDIGDADVGAEREGQVRRVAYRLRAQVPLYALPQFKPRMRGPRERAPPGHL